MPVINTTSTFAFHMETVSNTAETIRAIFTGVDIETAQRARITCDTQPLRFRYDGAAPTASSGHYLSVGETVIIDGNDNVLNLSFIAVSTDGNIAITLER